jgi:hypothetical protein
MVLIFLRNEGTAKEDFISEVVIRTVNINTDGGAVDAAAYSSVVSLDAKGKLVISDYSKDDAVLKVTAQSEEAFRGIIMSGSDADHAKKLEGNTRYCTAKEQYSESKSERDS